MSLTGKLKKAMRDAAGSNEAPSLFLQLLSHACLNFTTVPQLSIIFHMQKSAVMSTYDMSLGVDG